MADDLRVASDHAGEVGGADIVQARRARIAGGRGGVGSPAPAAAVAGDLAVAGARSRPSAESIGAIAEPVPGRPARRLCRPRGIGAIHVARPPGLDILREKLLQAADGAGGRDGTAQLFRAGPRHGLADDAAHLVGAQPVAAQQRQAVQEGLVMIADPLALIALKIIYLRHINSKMPAKICLKLTDVDY